MTDLHGYSTLTGEVIDLGLPEQDADEILELGEFAATGHDNLIVFTDKPLLQKWSKPDA